MKIAPEIVFRGVARDPFIDDIIVKEIAKLEKVNDSIISTRIAIEAGQKSHRTGNSYRVRIDIRIPDHREIKVERSSSALKRTSERLAQKETTLAMEEQSESENTKNLVRNQGRKAGLKEMGLPEIIRKTFDSARREAKKIVDKQAGQIKVPAQQQKLAMVERVIRDEDYGFLRTLDGRQLYFHRNSVLHNHWERLTVGVAVRYTEELGKKGPQATTVEMVEKMGAAEEHEELHELPGLTASRK
jgi:cold shock CspA family protein